MKERGRPRKFDRQLALRQAMQVFRERGYDGASLGDLTAVMGINSPSLYAAFGCKESLFREAVDLYVATDGAMTRKALVTAGTAREAVACMLREAARDFSGAPGRGCLVVLGAPHRTPGNNTVYDDLAKRRAQALVQLRRRLKKGIVDGDVPRGTDIGSIAAFYTTVLNGLSLQARDGASRRCLLGVVACAMSAWDALVQRLERPAP